MKIEVFGSHNGEAIVLHQEGEWTCVIDSFEYSGENPVKKYLNKLEINEIDLLIVTHPHDDHYNGVHSIWDEFDVKCVYDYQDEGYKYIIKVIDVLKKAYKSDEEPVSEILTTKLRRFKKYAKFRKEARSSLQGNYAKALYQPFSSKLLVHQSANLKVEMVVMAPFSHLYGDYIEELKIKAKNGNINIDLIEHKNENPNTFSQVNFFIINDQYKLLFLADATNDVLELMIPEIEKELPIDFIKASHHGSPNGNLEKFWKLISNQKKTCNVAITRHENHDLPEIDTYSMIHRNIAITGGIVKSVEKDTDGDKYLSYSINPSLNFVGCFKVA